MKLILFTYCVFTFILCSKVQCSTHWMVTENGLIQPRVDSPFEMARPYDLLAFLNQDTRWDNIIQLYHDLNSRKTALKKIWTELASTTDINTQLSHDDNCFKAGPLNLFDWYAASLEDGSSRNIPNEEFMFSESYSDQDKDIPDCKKLSSLTFSMFVFEHLEAMINRQNLTSDPELALPEKIATIMTVDQFGHWVANVLKKNSSSWLHYNMASLYWRIRGNAPKAMECSRRAVHYAPREYKDIALLSMGTVFHRSKKVEDAIVVLGAAVDHGPHIPVNHFVLANAYAIMGDYNSSVKHYDFCEKLKHPIEKLEKHKFGVLCHKTLMEKMLDIKESLNQLRAQLFEYSQREAHWLKSQASFLKTMKHSEKFDFINVENNCKRMSELTGLNIKELKKEGDKNSLIQYFLESPMYNENWLQEKGVHAVESAYSLQRLVQHIEKHANLISDYVAKTDHLRISDARIGNKFTSVTDIARLLNSEDALELETREKDQFPTSDKIKSTVDVEDSYFEYEGGFVIYPTTLKVNRNTEDFDKDPNWPTKDYCAQKSKTFPSSLEIIYPVFIPFENKGILLKYLLTDKIGLSLHNEHELPWHPPICPQDKDLPTGLGLKKLKSHSSNEGHLEHLKRKFLEYVGDGSVEIARSMQDAEIGQRIQTALEMEVAPKWLLYVLSSLYWRVRSNNLNALNCLLAANRTAPKRHKDLVLTSLASVYLEMGYVEQAFAAAEEAFHINLYEPATNFVLAQLNMIRKNWKTQQFHLKQVIRIEPTFMNGFARTLLDAISCHLLDSQKDIDILDGEVCAQVEPGMSLVCEKDGTNCHLTNIHCFGSRSKPEGSTLFGLLELHNELTRDGVMNEELLEQLRDDKTDIKDQTQHRKNFEMMHEYLDNMLKECGPQGCAGIHQIDAPKEAECTYQYLQRGYWMHILSLKSLLSEAQLKLPAEISTINPSQKKIPECKVAMDASQDYFMDKLTKVDVEGWEASLSIMHQVAEMFDVFNFGILGSKIAQYVDTHPSSWLGLLIAGWWCGAGGHGPCCARCLLAAYSRAPSYRRRLPLISLAGILHKQSKLQDAKDVAYILFYVSPKSAIGAFLVAVSHSYLGEHEQAVWMYRYAVSFDENFAPAKACMHATMCLMWMRENGQGNQLGKLN